MPSIPEKEFIKAKIRTRFGSVAAFEKFFGLPPESVTDRLRGRSNARVDELLGRILSDDPLSLAGNPDDSNAHDASHLLNSEAR